MLGFLIQTQSWCVDRRCPCRNLMSKVWHHLYVFLSYCSISELLHRKLRTRKHWNMLYKEYFNWAREISCITTNSLGHFREHKTIYMELEVSIVFPLLFSLERDWEGKDAFCFREKKIKVQHMTWCAHESKYADKTWKAKSSLATLNK